LEAGIFSHALFYSLWPVMQILTLEKSPMQWGLKGTPQARPPIDRCSSTRLCILTGVLIIYSGPHFPEFRIFRGISGFRRNTHRN
jgi:hypothetical protein